jgi:pilus assembly protein CpaF
LNLIVQATRLSDGSRRVTAISEITGMEGEVITLQDLFLFEHTGMSPDHRVVGRFRASGIRPKCSEKLSVSGHVLPMEMFEQVEYIN